jgi:hypothetical protein
VLEYDRVSGEDRTMDYALLVDNGEIISYALSGLLALLMLGVIQLRRRSRDVRKAREAVRLTTWSLAEPRVGPVAVQGTYHDKPEPRIDRDGHRIFIEGTPDVQAGTRATWKAGVRTYALRDGDRTNAIGVMAKKGESGNEWTMKASPNEAGVQLYAAEPKPAPPPLFPWRALVFFAICGAISFLGLYGIGTQVMNVGASCDESAVTRLQIASAMPLVRPDALAALARCRK